MAWACKPVTKRQSASSLIRSGSSWKARASGWQCYREALGQQIIDAMTVSKFIKQSKAVGQWHGWTLTIHCSPTAQTHLTHQGKRINPTKPCDGLTGLRCSAKLCFRAGHATFAELGQESRCNRALNRKMAISAGTLAASSQLD